MIDSVVFCSELNKSPILLSGQLALGSKKKKEKNNDQHLSGDNRLPKFNLNAVFAIFNLLIEIICQTYLILTFGIIKFFCEIDILWPESVSICI